MGRKLKALLLIILFQCSLAAIDSADAVVTRELKVTPGMTAFSTLKGRQEPRYTAEEVAGPLQKNCPNLLALDLGHNNVSDLSFVTFWPKLRRLIVVDSKAPVTDLSPLKNLPDLEYVELFMQGITDISPLAGKAQLLDLNLAHNDITDLTPLYSCTRLKRLWINGNPHLSSEQIEAFQKAVPGCTVNTRGYPSTGMGWREHSHYTVLMDSFHSGKYIPFADSAPLEGEAEISDSSSFSGQTMDESGMKARAASSHESNEQPESSVPQPKATVSLSVPALSPKKTENPAHPGKASDTEKKSPVITSANEGTARPKAADSTPKPTVRLTRVVTTQVKAAEPTPGPEAAAEEERHQDQQTASGTGNEPRATMSLTRVKPTQQPAEDVSEIAVISAAAETASLHTAEEIWKAYFAEYGTEENDPGVPLARNISADCLLGKHRMGPSHPLTDGKYGRTVRTAMKNGVHAMEITAPEGEIIGGLSIRWEKNGLPLAVQTMDHRGEWVTVATTNGDFFVDFVRLPGVSRCRLLNRLNQREPLNLVELTVLTPGRIPSDIQVWQKPEKVDLMLIAGHPDDELLWFGGLLPYYAGQLQKRTLVICCAMSVRQREHELCDALWACGVRVHPVYLREPDFSDTSLKEVLKRWRAKDETLATVTELIRRYRPDVLVLQDVNGEYGHGIHKAGCWLGQEGSAAASDSLRFPEQAVKYGNWTISKVYIHLWPENQIRMDWKKPLSSFEGKNALEVAQEALQYHRSQVIHGWKVEDGGEFDNSLFGLYYSNVGPDVTGGDMFEHIETAEENKN